MGRPVAGDAVGVLSVVRGREATPHRPQPMFGGHSTPCLACEKKTHHSTGKLDDDCMHSRCDECGYKVVSDLMRRVNQSTGPALRILRIGDRATEDHGHDDLGSLVVLYLRLGDAGSSANCP